jgi:hypothetical protein
MISGSAVCSRLLLLSAIPAASLFGAVRDVTIPLENGSVVIRDARFWGSDKPYHSTDKQLLLSFVLENRTSFSLNNVDLEFKMGGFCNGEPREWSYVSHGGYVTSGSSPTRRQFQEAVGPLPGKNMECNAEIIKVRLVFAVVCVNPLCIGNGVRRIEGPNEPLDIEKEFEPIRAKRAIEAEEQKQRDSAEAERSRQAAAVEAERKRKAAEEQARAAEEQERLAEEQAKKDAAEAARQRKKQAEADARYAKLKADEDARAAAERARVRAACSLIYNNTADKKVGDLTVREDQQVRACQLLGLYPPR